MPRVTGLLERDGVEPELAVRAVGALPAERERATAVAARRGPGRATAAFLTRRGFAEDTIQDTMESALGGAGGDE